MSFRTYDPEKDKKAAHRIWREVGWISDEKGEAAMDVFLSDARVLVADINDEPECLVASVPGQIRYLDEDLSLSAVAGVTTSRIARKQGFAKRLTAQLIAADVADGAITSALGMFEQGFYNQLGFGTGAYDHWVSFDPAQLTVQKEARVPRRITNEDWALVHAALLARKRGHGAVNLLPETFIKAEMQWATNGFGLGYADGPGGALTHFFWGRARGEHGPYSIIFMAYQNWDQFLELMAAIKNLGDQVRMIGMQEPNGIQLQDMIKQPFRHRQLTRKSEFENNIRASAYLQIRICDLAECLARTHLPGNELQFNLKLHDPIENHLPEDAPWRGTSGDYVVALGPSSGAEAGQNSALPTLTASVGAFTRLWLGVLPASSLAVTDELAGPPELIACLDDRLRLPTPHFEWDF